MPYFVQYRSPTLFRCSAIVESIDTRTSDGKKITYVVIQELTKEEAASRDLKALIRKYGEKDADNGRTRARD